MFAALMFAALMFAALMIGRHFLMARLRCPAQSRAVSFVGPGAFGVCGPIRHPR